MATDTSKSPSEKQQSAFSSEQTELADSMNKDEHHTTAENGDVLDETEKPEQPDVTQGPEKQDMGDGVAQNSLTEGPDESLKPEPLIQDGGKESPSQNGTVNKPEHTSSSPKKESQSKDNANKRLRFGPSQRNKSGPRAKNGSYHNYYKRRYNGIHGDDRLPIVRDAVKLQGENISILDVGCNDGTVTIEMASLDRCIEAVGIDIDPNLVGAARKNLRQYAKKEEKKTQAELEKADIQGLVPKLNDALPLSLRHSLQLMKEAKGKHKGDGLAPGRAINFAKFPHNVTFRREDFAQKGPTRTSQEVGKYDVVLCLSVTKWVHFAGGDEALKRLFRRSHTCLKPGGLLILEPQPQKSYKSAIRKGLGKKDFNGERKLKPPKFAEYLTKTVGFRKMKILRDVRHRGQAFNRPIMAFYKQRANPPTAVGMALSRHADVFLGVLPSDDDEDMQPHQEAVESQNGRIEQDAEMRNVVVGDDDSGEATREVMEEKNDNTKNGHADNDDEVFTGRDIQEIDRKEQEQEPSQGTLVGPSKAEVDATEQKTKATDEFLLAHDISTSSPKMSDSQAAVLSSSGLKSGSTSQEIEGIKPKSPKRGKHDLEERQVKTPLAGSSMAKRSASEIKTKAKDNCQLAKDVDASSATMSGSQAVDLPASGSKRKSTCEEVEEIKPRSPKRGKHDVEERQGQTPLAGPSMAETDRSEIETKTKDTCQRAKDDEASSEKMSGSQAAVLPSFGFRAQKYGPEYTESHTTEPEKSQE